MSKEEESLSSLVYNRNNVINKDQDKDYNYIVYYLLRLTDTNFVLNNIK